MNPPSGHSRPLYTVSELTREIKVLLEQEFPLVWIVGEISNLRTPTSGHHYFTLKDANAQINAVMFKGPAKRLKFTVADGLAVVGLGRLSIYEPRGTYQVIFEHLEPKGLGALQLAFEQLKSRLAAEGLFDAGHKKQLPVLPGKIHIITSLTGAVIHDTIHIIQRRFPNMPITVIPARVQGDGAVASLIGALTRLNHLKDAEVAILARGGGSLEDLQAFNAEPLARAIYASQVPIVSAVGHETDYTIADFVADFRAPTPSAAAEIVVPEKYRLQQQCRELARRLERAVGAAISNQRKRLDSAVRRLRDPGRQVQEVRLKLDDGVDALLRAWRLYLTKKQTTFAHLVGRMRRIPLHSALRLSHQKLHQNNYILLNSINNTILLKRAKYRELTLRLEALNPDHVLQRGYSITRALPSRKVVKASRTINVQQQVEIQLASGALLCRVEGKKDNGQENL
jgi:exodeoxyribonuclease VII large subunit